MQSVNRAEALEQTGLQGDRYSVGRGFWQVTEACQVTLISTDDLARAKKAARRRYSTSWIRGAIAAIW